MRQILKTTRAIVRAQQKNTVSSEFRATVQVQNVPVDPARLSGCRKGRIAIADIVGEVFINVSNTAPVLRRVIGLLPLGC